MGLCHDLFSADELLFARDIFGQEGDVFHFYRLLVDRFWLDELSYGLSDDDRGDDRQEKVD